MIIANALVADTVRGVHSWSLADMGAPQILTHFKNNTRLNWKVRPWKKESLGDIFLQEFFIFPKQIYTIFYS